MGLRIRFGEPEHGWMSVHLEADAQGVALDVSDAAVDSLLELCWALRRLAEGATETQCEWFLEPGHALWRFSVQDERLVLVVTIDEVEQFRHELDLASFLKKAVNALTKLSRLPVWETDKNCWSWPFPTSALEPLGRKVAGR